MNGGLPVLDDFGGTLFPLSRPSLGPLGLSESGAAPPPIALGATIWLDAIQQPLGAVPSWTDLTGNGNNFTQSTPSNQPTNTAAQFGSAPGVIGDGVDDILSSPVIAAATEWTAFFVVYIFVDCQQYGSIWNPASYPDTSNYQTVVAFTPIQIDFNNYNSESAPSVSSAPLNPGYCLRGGPSLLYIKDNVGNIGQNTADGSKVAVIQNLFGRNDNNLYAHIALGSLVYFPYILTTTQEDQMWAFLASRYNFTAPPP